MKVRKFFCHGKRIPISKSRDIIFHHENSLGFFTRYSWLLRRKKETLGKVWTLSYMHQQQEAPKLHGMQRDIQAPFFWRSRRRRKTERPCEKLQKGSRWLTVEIPGRRVGFPSPSLWDGRSLAQQLLRFHIPSYPLRAYNKQFSAMLRTRYLHKPQSLNFMKELVNTMSSSSIKPDLLFKKLLVLNELFSIMSSSSII